MDRKINKSFKFQWAKLLIFVLLLVVTYWVLASTDFSGNALKLDIQKLRISEVKYALLEDYIPIRGRVEPSRTVYLDAIEGGRVEDILAEEGAEVSKGDIILRLSNTNLQLDVISREAQVSEQLNNLRNTRLAIDKETLNLKSELVEIDYQLSKLKRTFNQHQRLFDKNLIAEDLFLATQDEFGYFKQRRELVIERQKTDSQVRKVQLEQLENSVEQLQKNLKVARKNLEHLDVKAPINGKLTALDVEFGESKSRGQRLGQVDKLDNFKVSALVDEFYIDRIQRGQQATANVSGAQYPLVISKVFSQVSNGQFKIELHFNSDLPGQIRRGQTLQIKLQLDSGQNVMVIDRGSFVQDTGGNWVFVLSKDESVAVKRNISPGKNNPEYLQIISGLQPGEKVVVSSYGGFDDKEKLIFNN